jgi:sRNA-binding carbon storage regulator CsrA
VPRVTAGIVITICCNDVAAWSMQTDFVKYCSVKNTKSFFIQNPAIWSLLFRGLFDKMGHQRMLLDASFFDIYFRLLSDSRGWLMQVISRAENESIQLGKNLTLTVVEITNEYVRLGITSTDGELNYWEEVLYLQTQAAELQLN